MNTSSLTITELKEFISDRYDPDVIVDLLELTTEQILEAFEDELMVNLDKIEIEDLENDDTDTR